MILDILTQVKVALDQHKAYIEVAFWCHGGKQRSVAAARLAEHVLKVYFQNRITVPPTKHMMRYWWSRIPCQMRARAERSLLAYSTLLVFNGNVHVSCSC